MRIFFLLAAIIMSSLLQGQSDTSKWLRAFPVTDYMVPLNDSTTLVQVELPETVVVKDKQLGVLYGVYNTSRDETVQKGYGRCYLIKGNYYYFAIGNNTSGLALKKGDLIYTMMERNNIYQGFIPKLALHYIRLTNVYDEPFYDRYFVLDSWSEDQEKSAIDSIVADIRFTGNYFKENNSVADVPVKSGEHKGKSTFDRMINCSPQLLCDFFDYIIARPRNYAGREWKISEIFATWISEGAPAIVKE